MTNFKPIFPAAPKTKCLKIVTATGTSLVPLFTAGADGSLIDSISVVSTDTVDVVMVLAVNDGATECFIGEVNLPAGAGSDGLTPAVNLFDLIPLPFLQSNGSLPLGPSAILSVAAKVAVTATKSLEITAYGGDY